MITWVGEDTFSQRLASITNGVFVAQFFNTGFLLLLVNANLGEQLPSHIAQFLNGSYYDYDQKWYQNVGSKIVQTMFVNAFIIPWVGLMTAKMVPWLKRKRNGGDPYKTKSTSMAGFKAIWSGGDYVIHFKYSGMMNIAYVTMMYGLGMPALFPIAAINYFNQYVAERMIVAWHMKAPAALDDTLTQNCIESLRFAPLLFLVNGCWMLSNLQMFKNVWFYIADSSKPMMSGHFFEYHVNWATPATIFALYSVAIYVIQKLFKEQLAEWGFQLCDKTIDVDEDLPNFFKSVKLSSADHLIKMNDNMKTNFGFEITDPDTIAILDATQVPKKAMQGTPWYAILSNELYKNEFNYIGAYVNERESLIEDGFPDEFVDGDAKSGKLTDECKMLRWEQSDMVMVLLNLAFIPDEVVHKINFKPGWSREFRKNMEEYKQKFFRETGQKWEFQNTRLEEDYIDFVHAQEANDVDAIKEKTVDTIDDKFKSFFKNIQQHRKDNANGSGPSGPIDLNALKNLNLGGNKTTIN